tara:strand:+ start:191 stop:505 length:315 start_codon:yes stop_codon:yes gene_type:complete
VGSEAVFTPELIKEEGWKNCLLLVIIIIIKALEGQQMMTSMISLRGQMMQELEEIMTLDLTQIHLQLVMNFSILLQSFQEPKTSDWTDSHQKTSGVKNIMKILT